MKRKYSLQSFQEAVANSTSIIEVLTKLGLKPAGGNYRSCNNLIKELSLDVSHFKGQGWSKGRVFGPKRPLEDYLSNRCRIKSHSLKLRLIQEGVFLHKCYRCDLTHWNDDLVPIELDHIDGNHENNNLSNLTILCPNCHAQTSNYRGKNKKS